MPEVDFTFNEILAQLSIFSEPGPIFNILIYIMFFLNLIAFFGQDDKQLAATLLLGLTLVLLMISKLNIIDPTDIASVLINSGIMTIPLIVTGMSKAKKTKPLTLIAGLLGVPYFFLYWWILQGGIGAS